MNTNVPQWANEQIQKAIELRRSAQTAAQALFQRSDLRELLLLICKLHHFDAFNLLLIWQQYPKATYLAGYRQWAALLPNSDTQLLKPEWRDKGIELIAPFTHSMGNDCYKLTWYAIKLYDISQTYLTEYCPSDQPYIPDREHKQRIKASLIDVISTEYHRCILHTAASSNLSRTGLSGQMDDMTIMIRDDINTSGQILFLCECLCQLTLIPSEIFDPSQTDLASQYIIYCLFNIWSIDPVRALRQPRTTLSSIPQDLQIDFISLIQRTVRSIDESVGAAYTQRRVGEGLIKF